MHTCVCRFFTGAKKKKPHQKTGEEEGKGGAQEKAVQAQAGLQMQSQQVQTGPSRCTSPQHASWGSTRQLDCGPCQGPSPSCLVDPQLTRCGLVHQLGPVCTSVRATCAALHTSSVSVSQAQVAAVLLDSTQLIQIGQQISRCNKTAQGTTAQHQKACLSEVSVQADAQLQLDQVQQPSHCPSMSIPLHQPHLQARSKACRTALAQNCCSK